MRPFLPSRSRSRHVQGNLGTQLHIFGDNIGNYTQLCFPALPANYFVLWNDLTFSISS